MIDSVLYHIVNQKESKMNNKVYYVILEDGILLSKKDYKHWREIQDEYYETFKASLGPWTYEELICYLEDDLKNENRWPFVKDKLNDFFKDNEIVLHSNR